MISSAFGKLFLFKQCCYSSWNYVVSNHTSYQAKHQQVLCSSYWHYPFHITSYQAKQQQVLFSSYWHYHFISHHTTLNTSRFYAHHTGTTHFKLHHTRLNTSRFYTDNTGTAHCKLHHTGLLKHQQALCSSYWHCPFPTRSYQTKHQMVRNKNSFCVTIASERDALWETR